MPQTSPPRDEPFEVTYRCALLEGHDGPHRGVVTDDLLGKLLREVPSGLDGAIQVLDMLLSGGDTGCGDWGGVGFCQIDRDAFQFVRAELLKAKALARTLARALAEAEGWLPETGVLRNVQAALKLPAVQALLTTSDPDHLVNSPQENAHAEPENPETEGR